jgi:hypothetical protein
VDRSASLSCFALGIQMRNHPLTRKATKWASLLERGCDRQGPQALSLKIDRNIVSLPHCSRPSCFLCGDAVFIDFAAHYSRGPIMDAAYPFTLGRCDNPATLAHNRNNRPNLLGDGVTHFLQNFWGDGVVTSIPLVALAGELSNVRLRLVVGSG